MGGSVLNRPKWVSFKPALTPDPKGSLKLDDFPMFRYQWEGNLDILKGVLSQVGLLIVIIGLVLCLGFWRMRRYEVT